MELVKINASYLTVRIPLEERKLWENLLVLSEKYLMALPKNVMPPASIGCPQHAIFEPTHSLCWIYYRPYNQYRLYRMWLEGGSLFFRIPVGGLILTLVKGKEEFNDEVKKNLREYLTRKYPPKGTLNFDPSKFPVELYPYQLRAVYGAINYRRAIISAPPGTGKTEIGSALIAAMPPNWQVAWFTHTRTLLRQSYNRLMKNLREPIGAISGEDDFDPRRVTVAMVQTVTRRGEEKNDPAIISWLRSLDAVILDEAHHAPAKTFYWTLMSCTKAWVRFGLTATPMREAGEEELYMWCSISPLIVEVSPHELVEVGRLVPIELVIYDLEGMVEYARTYRNWQEEYMDQIVRNKVRNYIIAAEAIVNRPTVILIWAIEHIQHIANTIQSLADKYGIQVKIAALHGDTPSRERMIVLEQFERGQVDILILSDVGKEGLNIINLKTLIIAAGQKSKVAAIQRVGRGMRPKKWGYVRVVDFYDAGDVTRRHSFKRVRTYQQMLPIARVQRLPAKEGFQKLIDELRRAEFVSLL
jgi:superfamily II DNA or RNA helicase